MSELELTRVLEDLAEQFINLAISGPEGVREGTVMTVGPPPIGDSTVMVEPSLT